MDFLQNFMWADYLAVLAYFPLCALGLMLHFLKKKVKTESFHDVRAYFTTHRVSTLTTILSAITMLYIFDAMEQLNVVSAILAGYASDSLFQKQVDAVTMRDPSILNEMNRHTSTGGGSPPPLPVGNIPDGVPIVTVGEDEPEEGA